MTDSPTDGGGRCVLDSSGFCVVHRAQHNPIRDLSEKVAAAKSLAKTTIRTWPDGVDARRELLEEAIRLLGQVEGELDDAADAADAAPVRTAADHDRDRRRARANMERPLVEKWRVVIQPEHERRSLYVAEDEAHAREQFAYACSTTKPGDRVTLERLPDSQWEVVQGDDSPPSITVQHPSTGRLDRR